jgi:hypothetical protein
MQPDARFLLVRHKRSADFPNSSLIELLVLTSKFKTSKKMKATYDLLKVDTVCIFLTESFNSQASVNTFTAAIMIADVTGFTPLTERALTSKRGTELVEELTVCMNNYFNEAIDMVFDYGGDIIKVCTC